MSNSDTPSIDELLDFIESYGASSTKSEFPEYAQRRAEAKALLQKRELEARIDEIRKLAQAHWQTSIPEQAILDRLKELKSNGK